MIEHRNGKPLSRQALYYHRCREELFNVMGRVCVNPGCGATEFLEFDVKKPVGDPKSHHERMSSTSRAAFYKRQHAAGNLQVLCKRCNSSKRDRDEVQTRIPDTDAQNAETAKMVAEYIQ